MTYDSLDLYSFMYLTANIGQVSYSKGLYMQTNADINIWLYVYDAKQMAKHH